MYKGIPFTETQKFALPKLLWMLGLGAVIFFLIQYVLPVPSTFFWVGLVPIGFSYFLFTWIRLDTTIDDTGVTVQFVPYHMKPKHYPWSEITRAYVRQYNPIFEYGGWGARYSFLKKSNAFNISGNQGLQLEFAHGKKLLIGTQLPAEIEEMLKSLGKG